MKGEDEPLSSREAIPFVYRMAPVRWIVTLDAVILSMFVGLPVLGLAMADGERSAVVIPAAAVAIGAVVLTMFTLTCRYLASAVIELDAERRALRVRRRLWVWAAREELSFALADLRRAEVREELTPRGEGPRVCLVLRTGESVNLLPPAASPRSHHEQAAKHINSMLATATSSE